MSCYGYIYGNLNNEICSDRKLVHLTDDDVTALING